MDRALTATWGPLGLAGRTGTAGTTATASAATTGAAAAASGRLITEGFACSHGTETLPNEVSHGSHREVEPGLWDSPRFRHWPAERPAWCRRGPVGERRLDAAGRQRKSSSMGGTHSSSKTPCLGISLQQQSQHEQGWLPQRAHDYWYKRALTLLEPSTGAPAGIICGDQTDHFNLSLL